MGEGEWIVHFGSTGSFAFYYPTQDLFFVRDVNLMSNPFLNLAGEGFLCVAFCMALHNHKYDDAGEFSKGDEVEVGLMEI